MFPKVVQVLPMEDYSVYVYFEDGKIVHYFLDTTNDKNLFKLLQNMDFFMKRCTVLNDTLAWDVSGNYDETACIDIDPFTLYELDFVKDPLEEEERAV